VVRFTKGYVHVEIDWAFFTHCCSWVHVESERSNEEVKISNTTEIRILGRIKESTRLLRDNTIPMGLVG
jgi:hypothetical protein